MGIQAENKEELSVNGFRFETKEDAELAKNELKAIHYIKENINVKSSKTVLELYKTLLEKKLCKTPIGYTYLRELQRKLLKNPNLPSEEIMDIPIEPIRNQIKEEMKSRNNKIILAKEADKKYKKYFTFSMMMNVALIAAVMIMFWVATTGNHPNIINYENKIIDKYVIWEQELIEREKAVEAYEKNMQIGK